MADGPDSPTTVRFPVTAVAPAGITSRLLTWKVRGVLARNLPPRPLPTRVSSNRTGLIAAKVDPCTTAGVTALEGSEDGPVPMLFVARTVNVYEVRFIRPATSQYWVPVVEQVLPSGSDVAVYPVIDVPPLDAGTDQVTRAEVSKPVAETAVGAPGTTGPP